MSSCSNSVALDVRGWRQELHKDADRRRHVIERFQPKTQNWQQFLPVSLLHRHALPHENDLIIPQDNLYYYMWEPNGQNLVIGAQNNAFPGQPIYRKETRFVPCDSIGPTEDAYLLKGDDNTMCGFNGEGDQWQPCQICRDIYGYDTPQKPTYLNAENDCEG